MHSRSLENVYSTSVLYKVSLFGFVTPSCRRRGHEERCLNPSSCRPWALPQATWSCVSIRLGVGVSTTVGRKYLEGTLPGAGEAAAGLDGVKGTILSFLPLRKALIVPLLGLRGLPWALGTSTPFLAWDT
jgi:hypothetical protein